VKLDPKVLQAQLVQQALMVVMVPLQLSLLGQSRREQQGQAQQ
tara:strand:+ start:554 stop:682 length:129 start_codon:yes stop_codon:yes gene_type:complete